jgi:hypothetical protein
MQHRYCFEAVHRMLQDVRSSTALFGGLPLIAGGDFAQILPVVRRGQRAAVVDACLQQSQLIWPHLTVLHLRQNMRVLSGQDNTRFAAWCRTLATPQTDGPVVLPDWITAFYSQREFLNHVYPQPLISRGVADFQAFSGRAILAVRNDTVASINAAMLESFPGAAIELLAVDSAVVDDASTQDVPPVELLQSFEPPSLPPSKLQLKVDVPVMLLRNLYPSC